MITTESSTNIEPQVKKRPLRILMVTGIYPTERKPHSGTFIKTVVEGLISEGHYVEVIHPSPGPVPIRYLSAAIQVFFKTLAGRFDIVDGNYGLWCLAARLQWTTPVVANFHGDDLLGTPNVAGSRTKKSLFVVYVSRWLCRFVDEVIVKSEQMKKIAMGDKIHIVPSCVDFDLFHPLPREEARASLNWAPDKYYILFGNDPHYVPGVYFKRFQASGHDIVAASNARCYLTDFFTRCIDQCSSQYRNIRTLLTFAQNQVSLTDLDGCTGRQRCNISLSRKCFYLQPFF